MREGVSEAMKSPLRYQPTCYDCGTTSLVNALVYLFDRKQVPLEVVRYITAATCDKYVGEAPEHRGGTSTFAMEFLANWLNYYASTTGFPVRCEYLHGPEAVNMQPGNRIEAALAEGAAVVAGVCLGADHYVLLTSADGDCVRLFDPYYDTWPLHDFDMPVVGVAMVDDEPFACNRTVERWVFDEPAGTPYSFEQKTCREALIFWNTGVGAVADGCGSLA